MLTPLELPQHLTCPVINRLASKKKKRKNNIKSPIALRGIIIWQITRAFPTRNTANKMLNFGNRGKSEYPGENPLGAEQGTNKFNQNVVSNTE